MLKNFFTTMLFSLCFLCVLLPVNAKTASITVIDYAPADQKIVNQIILNLWQSVAQTAALQFNLKQTDNREQAYQWLNAGKGDLLMGPLQYQDVHHYNYLNSNFTIDAGVIVPTTITLNAGQKITLLLRVFAGKALLLVLTYLLIFSVIFWLIERKHPKSELPDDPLRGIGLSLWFQVVSFATVGYGDVTPKTPWGRIITGSSLFIYILLFSVFVASITAEVTGLENYARQISSLGELQGKKVAYLRSEPLAYADIKRYHALPVPYDSLKQMAVDVAANKVSASFSNELNLRILIYENPQLNVTLTPFTVYHGDYLFLMKHHFPWENSLHKALYQLKFNGKITALVTQSVEQMSN